MGFLRCVVRGSSRAAVGTRAARRTRAQGQIPCILFGGDYQNAGLNIAVEKVALMKAIQESGSHPAFQSRIWHLKLPDTDEPTPVVPKQIFVDPASQQLLSITFQHAPAGSKKTVTLEAPIRFTGMDKCLAIRRGGYLRIYSPTAKIRLGIDELAQMENGFCFQADVSHLSRGKVIRFRELLDQLPESGKFAGKNKTFPICTIQGRVE